MKKVLLKILKLESGYFYMSLDPYDNSGLPNENDNLVIKAKNLIIIDEIGTSHTILG